MTTLINIVRETVGRRHKISRGEMRAILMRAAEECSVKLHNGWISTDRPPGRNTSLPAHQTGAEAWERACHGITIVSVIQPRADGMIQVAQAASSNPGEIRYDQPGSMHPMLMADIMFVPTVACEHDGTAEYLRRHARRLLIVTGEPEAIGQNIGDTPRPDICIRAAKALDEWDPDATPEYIRPLFRAIFNRWPDDDDDGVSSIFAARDTLAAEEAKRVLDILL